MVKDHLVLFVRIKPIPHREVVIAVSTKQNQIIFETYYFFTSLTIMIIKETARGKQSNIPIVKPGITAIPKTDVIEVKAVPNNVKTSRIPPL